MMNKKVLNINLMDQQSRVGLMLKLIKKFGILKVRHLIPLRRNLVRQEDLRL